MARRNRGDLTSQPHDAIIKDTFSQRKHAAGLLRAALARTVRKGKKEVKVDVLDELKRDGRAEGRAEGAAHILLRLLAARFGPVPAEAKARVVAATEATLMRWALRVLTAPTLAAVLGSATTKAAKKPASPARRATARKQAHAAR